MKYLFSFCKNKNYINFLRKMVNQNVIQHKILNDFCFQSFFCNKAKKVIIYFYDFIAILIGKQQVCSGKENNHNKFWYFKASQFQ